jgi:hypothetical protein
MKSRVLRTRRCPKNFAGSQSRGAHSSPSKLGSTRSRRTSTQRASAGVARSHFCLPGNSSLFWRRHQRTVFRIAAFANATRHAAPPRPTIGPPESGCQGNAAVQALAAGAARKDGSPSGTTRDIRVSIDGSSTAGASCRPPKDARNPPCGRRVFIPLSRGTTRFWRPRARSSPRGRPNTHLGTTTRIRPPKPVSSSIGGHRRRPKRSSSSGPRG